MECSEMGEPTKRRRASNGLVAQLCIWRGTGRSSRPSKTASRKRVRTVRVGRAYHAVRWKPQWLGSPAAHDGSRRCAGCGKQQADPGQTRADLLCGSGASLSKNAGTHRRVRREELSLDPPPRSPDVVRSLALPPGSVRITPICVSSRCIVLLPDVLGDPAPSGCPPPHATVLLLPAARLARG